MQARALISRNRKFHDPISFDAKASTRASKLDSPNVTKDSAVCELDIKIKINRSKIFFCDPF